MKELLLTFAGCSIALFIVFTFRTPPAVERQYLAPMPPVTLEQYRGAERPNDGEMRVFRSSIEAARWACDEMNDHSSICEQARRMKR